MLSRNSAPEQTWKRCGENLVKYTPSGTYYVRVRVAGKLHVKSLETPVLTVARQRLTDELHKLRARAASVMAARAGKMRVADAVAIYRERLEADAHIKLSTRKYYEQVLTALCDHRRVSEPKPRQDKCTRSPFPIVNSAIVRRFSPCVSTGVRRTSASSPASPPRVFC